MTSFKRKLRHFRISPSKCNEYSISSSRYIPYSSSLPSASFALPHWFVINSRQEQSIWRAGIREGLYVTRGLKVAAVELFGCDLISVFLRKVLVVENLLHQRDHVRYYGGVTGRSVGYESGTKHVYNYMFCSVLFKTLQKEYALANEIQKPGQCAELIKMH